MPVEPTQIVGDAPCPSCGVQLWFVRTSAGVHFHVARDVKAVFERLVADLSERNIHISRVMTGNLNSVEVVELVMAAEDSAALNIADEDAGHIQSTGDALHYLLTRLL
jgi:acyl carrier protein